MTEINSSSSDTLNESIENNNSDTTYSNSNHKPHQGQQLTMFGTIPATTTTASTTPSTTGTTTAVISSSVSDLDSSSSRILMKSNQNSKTANTTQQNGHLSSKNDMKNDTKSEQQQQQSELTPSHYSTESTSMNSSSLNTENSNMNTLNDNNTSSSPAQGTILNGFMIPSATYQSALTPFGYFTAPFQVYPPSTTHALHPHTPIQIDNNKNIYVRGLSTSMDDEQFYELCKTYGTIISSKAIIDYTTNNCKGFGFVMYQSKEDCLVAMEGLHKQGYQVSYAKESYVSKKEHYHHPGSFIFSNNDFHGDDTQYHQDYNYANQPIQPPSFPYYQQRPYYLQQQQYTMMIVNTATEEISNLGISFNQQQQGLSKFTLYVANLPTSTTESDIQSLFKFFSPLSIKMLKNAQGNFKGTCFIRMPSSEMAQQAISKLNGFRIKEANSTMIVRMADDHPRKKSFGSSGGNFGNDSTMSTTHVISNSQKTINNHNNSVTSRIRGVRQLKSNYEEQSNSTATSLSNMGNYGEFGNNNKMVPKTGRDRSIPKSNPSRHFKRTGNFWKNQFGQTGKNGQNLADNPVSSSSTSYTTLMVRPGTSSSSSSPLMMIPTTTQITNEFLPPSTVGYLPQYGYITIPTGTIPMSGVGSISSGGLTAPSAVAASTQSLPLVYYHPGQFVPVTTSETLAKTNKSIPGNQKAMAETGTLTNAARRDPNRHLSSGSIHKINNSNNKTHGKSSRDIKVVMNLTTTKETSLPSSSFGSLDDSPGGDNNNNNLK